jgi:ketosteroid isomerase-like protein
MPARTPIEVDDLFVKYMREGDLQSILDLYDSEIAFVNQAGEIKKGITVVQEELSHFAATKQIFQFNIKRVVSNGDIALVHNQWDLISPKKMSGYAIEVMRRQPDGTWRFFIGDPFTIGNSTD